jgi:hypothetical protein
LAKFTDLVNAFNKFTDGKSNTFDEAAVWADDIKSFGATMFDEYHFTNVYIIIKADHMTQNFYSRALINKKLTFKLLM